MELVHLMNRAHYINSTPRTGFFPSTIVSAGTASPKDAVSAVASLSNSAATESSTPDSSNVPALSNMVQSMKLSGRGRVQNPPPFWPIDIDSDDDSDDENSDDDDDDDDEYMDLNEDHSPAGGDQLPPGA